MSPHSLYGHQIMPTLATAGGILSASWYDSRSEPAFDPDGGISGQSPAGAIDGRGSTGLDVFYSQADTGAGGPLAFGPELRVTSQSFNPNLLATANALNPFIGDYTGVVANGANAFVVWTDNRDMNPTANASEDSDPTTDPPVLINARSRDSNIYFQKIIK